MIRRSSTILVPLAAVLIAGCTGFSDSNAVARFEDVELDADELTELSAAFTPPDVIPDPTDATAARDSLTLWVRIEAVKHGLDLAGVEITDETVDDATNQMSSSIPGFAELPDRVRDYLIGAQAAFLAFGEIPPPSESTLREFYEQGPGASGIACVAHILVETEDEAIEIVAELDDGADFATLAEERSIDPGSAQVGGVLACTPTETFAATFVPPFVEAALDAEIGVPTRPVATDFGFHVIRVRPFDEVRPELEGVLSPQEFTIARVIDSADIYIDPRYGTLSGAVVVALS